MNTTNQRHNFILGFIGALLGAIAGAVIYFIVTKIGYIAYISSVAGLYISFALYTKFAGRIHWIAIPICLILNIAALLLVDTYIITDYIINLPEYRAYGYTLWETMPLVLEGLFTGELIESYANSLISSAICLVVGLILGVRTIMDERKAKKAKDIQVEQEANTAADESEESSLKENDAYRNDRYDSEESDTNSSMDSDLGSLDSKDDSSF